MDPKITSLIEAMYDNVECPFVINGQLREWFKVEIGVEQGCLLLPVLLSSFLEFVVADPKSLWKEFNRYTNLTFDIRYADDTTILSTLFEKLQLSSSPNRKSSLHRRSVLFRKAKNSLHSRHIALAPVAFGKFRKGIFS